MRPLFAIILRIKSCTLILLITFSFQANAQNSISDTKADSLLQVMRLPTLDSLILITERKPLARIWHGNIKKYRGEIKNVTLHKLFQKIENLAAENKNPGLEMYAGTWQIYIEVKIPNSTYDFNTANEKIVEKASQSGVLWVEIIAKSNYRTYLIGYTKNSENTEKGIWLLRENIEKILKSDDVNLKDLLKKYYADLARYYYNMDDLPNAIGYSLKELHLDFPKGSKITPPNHKTFKNLNNNLGVFYRENQQLDSSTFYFKRVFDLPLTKNSSSGDSIMHIVSGGNLGENFYLQGDYEAALPLLLKDANYNIKSKTWGNASNALVLIADIYLIEGDLKKAKENLDKATFAAHSSKEIKRLSKLYPISSKYYRTIGEPGIALHYADSTIIAMDSLKRKNDQFRGARVEEAYNKDKIKRDKDRIEREKEKELKLKNSSIKQRNIGLFLLVVLLFIGYFIFRKFKLKAKYKESELANEIVQVTDTLLVKEELLNHKIQEINSKKNAVNWRAFKIYSDEQWEHFLTLFEKEHPNFIKNLKSKFPKVTPGEIRLLCTFRLGLEDKAIASILGVNVNSISQTRRRFMRKSNIEKLEDLKVLIFSI